MKVVQKNVRNINIPSISLFASCILWVGVVLHVTPNRQHMECVGYQIISVPIPFNMSSSPLPCCCYVNQHLICGVDKQLEPIFKCRDFDSD